MDLRLVVAVVVEVNKDLEGALEPEVAELVLMPIIILLQEQIIPAVAVVVALTMALIEMERTVERVLYEFDILVLVGHLRLQAGEPQHLTEHIPLMFLTQPEVLFFDRKGN
jgi:hypothetical protein